MPEGDHHIAIQQCAAQQEREIVITAQCGRRRRRSEIPAAVEEEDWPSSSDRMRRAVAARSSSASSAATKKGSRGGVYQRQPGRWAVDFRDRQLKVRKWLGTFGSEEAARAAYDAFEVQARASATTISVAPPSAPVARGCRGRVKIQQAAPLRASGRQKKPQPEETTTAKTESSQATASASPSSEAAPPPSSTTSAATPLLVIDPFLGEDHLAADDDHFGFGLADLAHLPLPFLDGDDNHMEFRLSDNDDLSLLDIGFM